MAPELLIVGNRSGTNVGGAFERAAATVGVGVGLIETNRAMQGAVWRRRACWWLLGRRPSNLARFSNEVVSWCKLNKPTLLLACGIAPMSSSALKRIGDLGVRRINYLTDDPWNPAHKAQWFLNALCLYDHVFSTRRANLEDLGGIGCRQVSHLPFAYAPELHYHQPPHPHEISEYAADITFAGGADYDRVPLMTSIIKGGFTLSLYGRYWERFAETRPFTRGQADPEIVRKAVAGAKVTLCLVRRANRDGSAMRTFEAAAMGACMLTEDTPEHREILGCDGESVVYFSSPGMMQERLRWLLANDAERLRLGRSVRERIRGAQHTYADRLRTMLAIAGVGAAA